MALTVATYGDLLWGEKYELLSFDDYAYVRDNPHVLQGLNAKNVRWALTSYWAFNWHPLTWISLQLDVEIFGADPRGFHVTNLLLHALNTALLFLVLLRSTGAVGPSAVVAALFSVHPLHVESVAWVSERKDVLSTFFWLLTMLAYIRYVRQPSATGYVLVLCCFILGLMSKPMVVTLPCVLMLWDYWPLRRLRSSAQAADSSGDARGVVTVSWWRLVKEKIPFLLLSAACSMLTVRAQAGLVDRAKQFVPFEARLSNALVSYVAYLRQMCWPSDLAVLYLHPRESIPPERWALAGVILTVVMLLSLGFRHRLPYLIVGWLWYLGTLVPAIGIVQVGQQARADRYTYIPLIGVFIALSWLATDFLGRKKIGRLVAAGLAATLIIACVLTTRTQLRYWHNNVTLWDRAIQVSGDHPQMYTLVIGTCLDFRELDSALVRAQTFNKLHPDDWRSHHLLGVVMEGMERPQEALECFDRALAIQPDSTDTHTHAAGILWGQGKISEAFTHLAVVARLQPDSTEGLYHRGIVLHQSGQYAEAVRCFSEVTRRDPNGVLRHVSLALALQDEGRDFPDHEYRRAFEINPTWPEYCDRLAWTLATHPDTSRRHGPEALRMARAACTVSNDGYPPFLETLAAAYAETGAFQKAIETANRARGLAAEAKDNKRTDRLDAALRHYRKGVAYRTTEPR